jgi:hypothetical protein
MIYFILLLCTTSLKKLVFRTSFSGGDLRNVKLTNP